MPNVKGLITAPEARAALANGQVVPFGAHATVARTDEVVSLTNHVGQRIAVVDFTAATPRVSVRTEMLNPLTATAVNVFLAPYGKVIVNWRTKGREWKPLTGSALKPKRSARTSVTPRLKAPPKPVAITPEDSALPAEIEAMENALAEVIAAPVITPGPVVPPTSVGPVLISGERVWHSGPRGIKPITKTWSRVGVVMAPTTDVDTMEMAWRARAKGRPSAVLITGPAGTAKTLLAQEFAFAKGVSFINVECQKIQTAADWFGGLVPDTTTSTGWKWEWTEFGKALRRGTPCVINLDELNRVDNERALNGVMSLLAWTAESHPLTAPEAVRLPPGIMITATLNEGVEYVGTVEVDAAVRDRLTWGVRMDYSKENIEVRVIKEQVPGIDSTAHGPDLAKRLVRVAQTQRAKAGDDTAFPSHNRISTRVLIEVADAIVDGASPTAAIWGVCRSRFQPEDFPALSVLIEAQFGAEAGDINDLPDDDELEQMLAADEAF